MTKVLALLTSTPPTEKPPHPLVLIVGFIGHDLSWSRTACHDLEGIGALLQQDLQSVYNRPRKPFVGAHALDLLEEGNDPWVIVDLANVSTTSIVHALSGINPPYLSDNVSTRAVQPVVGKVVALD